MIQHMRRDARPDDDSWLLFVALIVGCVLALVGCAPGADGARQGLATSYAIIGVGYTGERVYVRTGHSEAVKIAKAGNDAAATTYLDKIEAVARRLLQVLDVASDGAEATGHAIDLAEKAKAKDYSGATADALKVGADVIAGFAAAGVTLPIGVGK